MVLRPGFGLLGFSRSVFSFTGMTAGAAVDGSWYPNKKQPEHDVQMIGRQFCRQTQNTGTCRSYSPDQEMGGSKQSGSIFRSSSVLGLTILPSTTNERMTIPQPCAIRVAGRELTFSYCSKETH